MRHSRVFFTILIGLTFYSLNSHGEECDYFDEVELGVFVPYPAGCRVDLASMRAQCDGQPFILKEFKTQKFTCPGGQIVDVQNAGVDQARELEGAPPVIPPAKQGAAPKAAAQSNNQNNNGNQQANPQNAGQAAATPQANQQSEAERIAQEKKAKAEAEASYTVATQKEAVEEISGKYEQCQKDYKDTERCCTHPEQCISESLSGSHESGGIAYKGLQAVGILAGQFPASSIGQVCGTMKTVATSFAVINSALALKCEQKIRTCKQSCEEVGVLAKAKLEELVELSKDSGIIASGSSNTLTTLRTEMRKVAGGEDRCKVFNTAVVEKAAQALQATYSAKMADMCKNQAANQYDPNSIVKNDFNVDCTSASNAANPICQSVCNRQGWESDPACRAVRGLPPLGGTILGATGGSGSGSGAYGNSALGTNETDLDEDQQDFLGDNTPAGTTSAKLGQGGGGAGAFGSGGGGDGPGRDPGADGGGGAGLNTDILGGSRTGGGFSMPSGGRGSGLSGGYALTAGGRKPASDGKPFNPRDYLPGGKLDPKRKIAGLSAASPDIGAVHGNIFTNISNRFYQVCLRDGLYDCQTLRKMGRQGN